MTLLVATTNRGKLAELGQLLADLPIELVPLSALLPNRPPPVEDGSTFEENALIKARAASIAAMMPTLAEDSGLEIDALGGRPGVRSARFSKEGATDAENNAAVLKALEDIEDDQRTARFRCAMVLLDPWHDGDGRELPHRGPLRRPHRPSSPRLRRLRLRPALRRHRLRAHHGRAHRGREERDLPPP